MLTNKKVVFLKKYEVYHEPWTVLSSTATDAVLSRNSPSTYGTDYYYVQFG